MTLNSQSRPKLLPFIAGMMLLSLICIIPLSLWASRKPWLVAIPFAVVIGAAAYFEFVRYSRKPVRLARPKCIRTYYIASGAANAHIDFSDWKEDEWTDVFESRIPDIRNDVGTVHCGTPRRVSDEQFAAVA